MEVMEKLKPLYEVKLHIKGNDHYYTIGEDPKFYQGVTGILGVISKFALIPWTAKETALYMQKRVSQFAHRAYEMDLELLVRRAKKQHRFIKEKAAEVGSYAHSLFDKRIKEGIELEENPYKESFDFWLKNEKLKIIAGDLKIGSKTYGYGGSLDAVGVDDNGRLWVIDFKTGKSIWDSHAYQVGSYAQALMETYGLDQMPEGVIVRFEKDKPQFERKEVLNIRDSFNTFLHAKQIFDAEKRDKFINRELIKKAKEK